MIILLFIQGLFFSHFTISNYTSSESNFSRNITSNLPAALGLQELFLQHLINLDQLMSFFFLDPFARSEPDQKPATC